MEKQHLADFDTKDLLRARGRDLIHPFILEDLSIRGALIRGDLLIREMAANHGTGPLETLILGQAYLAIGLMGSLFKGQDRVRLQFQTQGPLGGFSVEATATGEVRGYLYQNPIPVENSRQWTLEQIVGPGTMTVTRFPEEAKAPVTGTVELQYSHLARDLSAYYLQSEQLPTAFNLNLTFDPEGNFQLGAGLMLQALPGARDADLEYAFSRLTQLTQLAVDLSLQDSPEEALDIWFMEARPKKLPTRRVEFFCPCNRNRFQRFLQGLPEQEKESIRREGPFPLEIKCHHCATVYHFQEDEIQSLLAPGT